MPTVRDFNDCRVLGFNALDKPMRQIALFYTFAKTIINHSNWDSTRGPLGSAGCLCVIGDAPFSDNARVTNAEVQV